MAHSSPEFPFEAFTTTAWRARVEKELKGKSYDDFLLWKSLDGFDIEAWQDQLPAVKPELPALKEAWKIVEPVYETDAAHANKHALASLMEGAEAIWFEKGFLGAAAEVATKGIDAAIAPIFIDGGTHRDPYRELLKTGTAAESHAASNLILDGLRLRERGANVIQEVALLIAQGLEQGETHGFDAPFFFKSGLGVGFLTELAKLRALRWLWCGILNTRQQPAENPTIMAVNLARAYAQNDEHTNILRATSSAMAAAAGGANYIMMEPWDRRWKENHAFSHRISRNIQTLMKEEGRMDKNLNPADGSYFIEHLTVAIAQKAWALVQDIDAQGGFTAFAQSGKLKEMLAASRDGMLKAYQSDAKVLLGVNKFPPAEPITEQTSEASTYALLPDVLHLPSELQTSEA